MGVFFPHGSGTRKFVFSGTRLLRGGNYGRFFHPRFRNSEVYFFRHEAIAGWKLWAFFSHTVQELGSLFFPVRGHCGEETMGVFLHMVQELGSGFFPARGYCGEETMAFFCHTVQELESLIFTGTRLLRGGNYGRFFPTRLRNSEDYFFRHEAIAGRKLWAFFFPHGSGTRKFAFSGTRLLREGNYGRFFPTRFRNSGVIFSGMRLLRGGNYGRFFSHGRLFFPARGHCGEETMGVFFPHGSGTRKFIVSGTRLLRGGNVQELGS